MSIEAFWIENKSNGMETDFGARINISVSSYVSVYFRTKCLVDLFILYGA